MKRCLVLCVAAVSLLLAFSAAQAQAFPGKPIRIVVPFPPGGSTDVIARLIADPMSRSLGQPVVVENRAGAAGTVGTAMVAKADPDGYTLLATNMGPAALAFAVNPRLAYHPVNDFAPISLTGVMPLVMSVSSNSPYRNIEDVIAAAKARPGKLNYATTGNGTTSHLVISLLNSTAGIKAVGIPYKGGPEVATATVQGDVDYMLLTPSDVIGLTKAGKLRTIAITSAQRSALMPDVPTLAEGGLPGFSVEYWNGLFAPARTPPAIIEALNKAVVQALESPAVKLRMAGILVQPAHSSASQFQAMVRDEVARWTRVVQDAGIQPE